MALKGLSQIRRWCIKHNFRDGPLFCLSKQIYNYTPVHPWPSQGRHFTMWWSALSCLPILLSVTVAQDELSRNRGGMHHWSRFSQLFTLRWELQCSRFRIGRLTNSAHLNRTRLTQAETGPARIRSSCFSRSHYSEFCYPYATYVL